MTIFSKKTIKKMVLEEHCVNIILKNNKLTKIDLTKVKNASIKRVISTKKSLFYVLAVFLPLTLLFFNLVILEITVIISLLFIILLNVKFTQLKKYELVFHLKNGDTNTLPFSSDMKPEIVGKVSAIRSKIYYFNLEQ